MTLLSTDNIERLRALCDEGSDAAVCRKLGISHSELVETLSHAAAWVETHPQDLQTQLLYERARNRRLENSLAANQSRFSALLGAMIAAVVVVDGRCGLIKQANDRADELFGYPGGAMVGLSVEELVPQSHRAIHPAYRIGFLSSARKREMGYHPPIYGVRADGEKIEMAIALTVSTSDDDVMVICTTYEIWAGIQSWQEERQKG